MNLQRHVGWFVLLIGLIAGGFFTWGFLQHGWPSGWLYLDRFGLVSSILAFVPIVYAVYVYVRKVRHEEIERQVIRREPGSRLAILIIEVKGNIRNQVENYLLQQDRFSSLSLDDCIYEVQMAEHMEAGDLSKFRRDLNDAYEKIATAGVDKIHLFIRGPAPVSVIAGQLLANRIPTILYHFQPNKGYQNWGVLQ